MIGQTISHYKILEKLGEGGMGVVYKAEDLKLKRIVALKFLPPELTRDPEAKERFIQEAQAASALDHPNICVIHEIDETEDGQLFIVMACYEGGTLKEKLKHGALSIEDTVDIIVHVANGLSVAHEAGITHRDIKPANIMITKRSEVKILDFGLAKLAGKTRLTKTGETLGTVAYMSPEQAQGENVDHRTDIWSLGVVFYEMLTGELPFKGDYPMAIMYSILNENPKSLISVRSDIPNVLEQVVCKALEKEPTLRYQNMQEFVHDLKNLPSFIPTSIKQEKSIVVLPFEDISPGKDNEYFSDGLTEEIITDLSKINSLRVISRTSAMMLKGMQKSIREIAKTVNVQYVLEGSVRKAGDNLRITAQLIDAINDTHLWAEKYSGTTDDVFDIQEKVSQAIVDALKLKLTSEEKQKMAERPIVNVQAYECYLRARQQIYLYTESALELALQLLTNGLAIVGENSILYAAMGLVYVQFFNSGIKTDEAILHKAEEYADRVLKLEPDTWHCHHLFGMIARHRGNAKKAIKHLKQACDIYPNDPDTLMWLGYLYAAYAGKTDAAKPLVKKLMEIDPLTPVNYFLPGMFYCMENRLDEAISSMRKWLQMDPQNRWAKFLCARLLGSNKQLDEAFELIDQMLKDDSQDIAAVISLFSKYALQGEKVKALQTMTEEVKNFLWKDPDAPWFMAGYYSLIDEKEQALDWFERALNQGWMNYPLFNEYDPHLENIRSEERFKKLMEKAKYEWEHFEV